MPALQKLMGNELSEGQYSQINAAELREFHLHLPAPAELSDRLYFLWVEPGSERILACAYLKPIYPVLFFGETFSFLNVGGVIANEKGKGYGKAVMKAIREYLLDRDQTGLGFCFPHIQGFYEKCGFKVDATATPRVIYRRGAERFTAEGQYILYLESSDRLMEKVLSKADQEVYVPDPSIW